MHKAVCRHSTEENKSKYESIKNKSLKANSKAMKEMAEETITELKNCTNWMFRLVKLLNTDIMKV